MSDQPVTPRTTPETPVVVVENQNAFQRLFADNQLRQGLLIVAIIAIVALFAFALGRVTPVTTSINPTPNDAGVAGNNIVPQSTVEAPAPTQPPAVIAGATEAPATLVLTELPQAALVSANIYRDNPSQTISWLDYQFNNGWKAYGGAWTQNDVAANFTLRGGESGLVFWTDLFENAQNLPAGVRKLSTQGGWGVYALSANTNYPVPMPNGGGRFVWVNGTIMTTKVSIAPTSAPSAAVVTSYYLYEFQDGRTLQVPQKVFDFLSVIPKGDVNEAIKFMDGNTNASTDYFAKGKKLSAAAGTYVLVWTNFHTSPSKLPANIYPVSTEGGWGVWLMIGNDLKITFADGGGMTIVELK